jgi:hypothetical protein
VTSFAALLCTMLVSLQLKDASAEIVRQIAVAAPSARANPSAMTRRCFVMFQLAVWSRLQSLSSVLRKPASAAGVTGTTASYPNKLCMRFDIDRKLCNPWMGNMRKEPLDRLARRRLCAALMSAA